jgi:hypothetical protein
MEALSLIRVGDVPGAITRLESDADTLTTNMAAHPDADQRPLADMKTYPLAPRSN